MELTESSRSLSGQIGGIPDVNAEWLFEYQLANGIQVRFRHVSPDDAELVIASYRTASQQTRLNRFFTLQAIPLPMIRQLLTISRPASLCLIGQIEQNHCLRIICGVRFVRRSNSDKRAEFAVTVHDEFQRRGLGTFMMRRLFEEATLAGIETLEGYILPSNSAMRRMICREYPHARWHDLNELIQLQIPVQQSFPHIGST